MKTLKKSAVVLGLISLLAGTTTLVRAQDYQNSYQDDGYSTGNISLQTFYDELSPYGTWIQDPQYGYVWRPDVDQSEFRPYYTNGRWAMTEYGNTWVSNYNWGWAPFHYGRWVINSYRQWIWLPDTNWGPAWVDWRSGDGYYGWAPMAPAISINLSFGRRYAVPEFCWNFIPQRNIYINTFPRYDYGRNNVYIRNTTIINNTYVYNRRTYYGGPRIEDIRRATNRDVTVYRYAQSNRPGASRIDSREVSIYRPRPERNGVDNRSAAPRAFERGNAGISRPGRNEGIANRNSQDRSVDQRNNDNRFGSRNDNRSAQPGRGNDASIGRDNQPVNRGDVYNRNNTDRISRGSTNGIDQRNNPDNVNRAQDQQRFDQMRQQRGQQDRMSQDQQRAQRLEQMQQQRSDQTQAQQQERTQRNEQMQQQRAAQMDQQRAQRNEQMQQQRNEQAQAQQQERAQRNEQMQQQRAQQAEQQRVQRDAQVQQQRAQQQQQMQQRSEQRRESAPPQQRGGGERSGGERPSRGGRG